MNLTQLLVTQKNVDEISAAFGLSEEQTLEAMAAVIPAFSEGLKRQTNTAQGAAGLIQALSSGRHEMYIDDPRNAVSEAGIQDGQAILGHLFGNKDVSRAVADHAAATSGIGSTVIKNLLPVLASMVMGSLFKGASGARSRSGGNIGGALGKAAGGGLLGSLIEGLAGGVLGGAGKAAPRRRTRSRSKKTSGSLEDLLGQVLGGGSQQKTSTPMPRSRQRSRRAERRQNPQSGGLGDLLDSFLGGGQSSRRRQDPRAQTPRRQRQQQHPAPRRRSRGGIDEIFGDMLEPGGQTSREYQRQTGSVFDEFLGE